MPKIIREKKIDKLTPMLVGKIKLLIMNPKFSVETNGPGRFVVKDHKGQDIVTLDNEEKFHRIVMWDFGTYEHYIDEISYFAGKDTVLDPTSAFAQIEEAFIKRYNQDQHEKAAEVKKAVKAKEVDKKKQEKEVAINVAGYIDSLLKQNS